MLAAPVAVLTDRHGCAPFWLLGHRRGIGWPGARMQSASAMPVVLNLFHCWDPLNATNDVWDPQVKIEKVCAPE